MHPYRPCGVCEQADLAAQQRRWGVVGLYGVLPVRVADGQDGLCSEHRRLRRSGWTTPLPEGQI
jgi:hypothetical protein